MVASDDAIAYRLQEYIPKEDLPEIITINDPCDKLSFGKAKPTETIPPTKYMRILPMPGLDNGFLAAATSHLLSDSSKNSKSDIPAEMDLMDNLGDGNHSSVSRATIQFPGFAIPASVGVKIASPGSNESDMLEHEALIYDGFHQRLSKDWSRYHHMEEALYDGSGIVPVKAIVPKFYGYYIPMVDEFGFAEPDEHALSLLSSSKTAGNPLILGY